MYVDGVVFAVPTAKKSEFRKHAEAMDAVFKKNGALKVVECWGDDVPDGKVTSFPMAVKRKDDETVVFSWIEWPSREVRDRGMKASMEDPSFSDGAKKMPIDGQRIIFGGIQSIFEM